jgi:serine protease inhibitor
MTTPRIASALLGTAVLLAACGQALPTRPAAQVCTQRTPAATPGGDALAAASRFFGLGLARQLVAGAGDDVFVSPLSAQMALAMAAAGARGATQAAMLAAMGLGGLSGAQSAHEAGALLDRLASGGCATIELANGLWARRGLALDPGYVRTVQSVFRGAVRPLDSGSAKVIDDWASKATHGRITSIVDRVPPDVILYLVNATYFHGEWQEPFDPGRTRPAPFHRAGAADVTVPLMDRTGTFTYGEGPGYQAVALPYSGGAVRLVVVLPSAPLAPPGFAPYLDLARFEQVTGSLQAGQPGELRLPRVEVDFTASLLGPLAALGMRPALQPGADFSGLAPSCALRCFISDVTQKTRLEVDEQGTTAAAATRVGLQISARLGGAPFRMVVDRPFLAAIQDVESGTLLFIGVIGSPKAGP